MAFWIVVASAATTIVNLAILLLTFIWAAFSDPTEARTFMSYGHLQILPANFSLGVTIGGNALVLIIAGVLMLLAFRLRQGSNRARILLTIVGASQLVEFIWTPRFDALLLVPLAAAVFLILVWLSSSTHFIQQSKAERSTPKPKQITH
ncbi:hypothetical protein C5B96_06275 [Subtercola sp. Z020]|uniref:hypothetical protein n=1 Tax=Subtercola sp. Z020 TaxID=2080582 RepID=UPI000CE9307A|nr:hypothetical protein [Subtercola sp. Z020]PPF85665.1 hypothetical protein C5B96_06275 [Subtercola sp. Z020]